MLIEETEDNKYHVIYIDEVLEVVKSDGDCKNLIVFDMIFVVFLTL